MSGRASTAPITPCSTKVFIMSAFVATAALTAAVVAKNTASFMLISLTANWNKVLIDSHELEFLRKVRVDLSNKIEELIRDLQGHQVEIETMYKNNKALRFKIKKLEGLLYGRSRSSK